jgi:lysophospholipase L1-like esterase
MKRSNAHQYDYTTVQQQEEGEKSAGLASIESSTRSFDQEVQLSRASSPNPPVSLDQSSPQGTTHKADKAEPGFSSPRKVVTVENRTSYSFDLAPITSTSARNRTLFSVTQAGTHHSRNGLYIRPSWKQVLRAYFTNWKNIVGLFIVILLCIRPFHSLMRSNHGHGNQGEGMGINGDGDGGDNDGGSNSGDNGVFGSGSGSSSPLTVNPNSITLTEKDWNDLKAEVAYKNNIHSSNMCAKELPQVGGSRSSPSSSCQTCQNPMIPTMGVGGGHWEKAFEMNRRLVFESEGEKLDIVFYGDSITEEWNGRWLGDSEAYGGEEGKNGRLEDIHSVFRTHFNKRMMRGMALGIAGDTIPQLLYRLQNGELTDGGGSGGLNSTIDSKIFWLLIGTNDLARGCSPEVVFLGIIRIVEEMRRVKPDTIVVINALLPRTDRADGKLVMKGQGADEEEEQGFGNSGKSEWKSSSKEVVGEDYDIEDDDEGGMLRSRSLTRRTDSSKSSNATISLDYWRSILSINKALKRYAIDHEKVEYFDANDIFIGRIGNSYFTREEPMFLMKELQKDYLHPTALGHELWANEIVDFITSDVDTPDILL